MNTSNNDTPAAPIIRIAKIGTCPSISGLSELSFHLGYEANNPQRIHLRLVGNSGNGKVSPKWLALADLEQALASIPADGAFKASVLAPLFRGVSTNNLHFSIAVLQNLSVLKKAEPPAEGYPTASPPWAPLRPLPFFPPRRNICRKPIWRMGRRVADAPKRLAHRVAAFVQQGVDAGHSRCGAGSSCRPQAYVLTPGEEARTAYLLPLRQRNCGGT